MAKLVYVRGNRDNVGGKSSKGYSVRRTGRTVICRCGSIEVHGGGGGRYQWFGRSRRTIRKRFRTGTEASAFVARMVAKRLDHGYDKLPGRVRIFPARRTVA